MTFTAAARRPDSSADEEGRRMSHPEPVGLYLPFVRVGELVALSAISTARDGMLVTGKLGRDLDLEAGQAAARRAAENLLSVLLDAAGGDYANVERLLLVRGYVNAADDFGQVHKVIDAASALIIERLGDKGRHARTALGLATLPNNNAVTLEAIAVLKA
jgi:enamine deaminase RidA (YjgF/YER057c/UK114 family)